MLRPLALLGLAAASSLHAADYWVYFGSGAEAISVSRFNSATGELSDPKPAAELARPNFLAVHPTNRFLYAAARIEQTGAASGAVVAYALDAKTGVLQRLNAVAENLVGPAHLNVDATGKMLVTANYTGGATASMNIEDDGSLGGIVSFVQHAGSSVHPERQTAPHAHSANFSPDNRFVVIADLGLDELIVYKTDPRTGKLAANDPPFARVEPGAGPRHFTFHPNSRWAYVINELASTVTAFFYDAERGGFLERASYSTLPDGYSGRSTTAEVLVHPSGKFLYGSNRGHDSIAVFAIGRDGLLTPVEREPTQGETPRNFRIDPTGGYLLAANQASDSVVVFQIDAETGALTPTGRKIEVAAPMCVRFVPVAP